MFLPYELTCGMKRKRYIFLYQWDDKYKRRERKVKELVFARYHTNLKEDDEYMSATHTIQLKFTVFQVLCVTPFNVPKTREIYMYQDTLNSIVYVVHIAILFR